MNEIVLVGTGGLVLRVGEDSVELHRAFTFGEGEQWARLTHKEVREIIEVLKAQTIHRVALAEKQRIEGETQTALTQEAIDRMGLPMEPEKEWLETRMEREADRRGWID